MGKQMQNQNVEDRHRECIWSIIHIVKNPPWRPLKRKLNHRKGGSGRSLTRTVNPGKDDGSSAEKLKEHDLAERRNSTVEEKRPLSSSAAKNSVTGQIKSLISKEKSKKHHRNTIDQPSNHDSQASKTNNIPLATNTLEETKYIAEGELINARKFAKDAPDNVYKDVVDAFDIINRNKDLLLTLLQHPDSTLAHHFHNQQVRSANMTYSRSTSFPLRGSSYGSKSSFEATQILRKLADYGSLPIGETQLCSVSETQKSAQSVSSEDFCEQSISLVSEGANNRSSGSAKAQDEIVLTCFENLKQKVKNVIRERRKEKTRIAKDAIFHKIPQGHGISKDLKKEVYNKLTGPTINREGEDSHSISHSLTKHHQHGMRRTPSLEEPLDKYNQLYETSFSREGRHPKSEQLKSRTGELQSPLRSPQSIKRILSLPDLSFSYSNQNEDFSYVLSPSLSTMSLDSSSSSQRVSLDLIVSSEGSSHLGSPLDDMIQENSIKVVSIDTVIADNVGSGSDSNEINRKMGMIIDDEQDIGPIKALEFVTAADGNWQTEESSSSKPGLPDRLDTKDKAHFNYVRDILLLSGFIGECLDTWHSNDQPLDPLLCEEMEGDSDLPSCKSGQCNHRFLFDILNEVLLDIYGSSYSYCPVQLSSLSHIRPMPAGQHVLEEVWSRVSWHLSSKPKGVQKIDNVVSRDLDKRDEWVNLQFHVERVGLEVEGLIFDDLMNKVILELKACC